MSVCSKGHVLQLSKVNLIKSLYKQFGKPEKHSFKPDEHGFYANSKVAKSFLMLDEEKMEGFKDGDHFWMFKNNSLVCKHCYDQVMMNTLE